MLESLRSAFERCRDMDETLDVRLAAFADVVRDASPTLHAAVDRFIARLRDGEAGSTAPQVGDTMPDFLLPNFAGKLVALDDLVAGGPVALVFHRGHWCPYCRLSVGALARARTELRPDGVEIVAIVPEIQQFAEAFQNEDGGGSIPVLSDVDNGVAASLGLVVWLGDELTEIIRGLGLDLSRYQGNDAWSVPIPATFVVDRAKRITARFVDPDYRKRMPIDQLLAAARAARLTLQ